MGNKIHQLLACLVVTGFLSFPVPFLYAQGARPNAPSSGVGEKKGTPVEITFPTSRKFQHSARIKEQNVDDQGAQFTSHSLLIVAEGNTSTDDNSVVFVTHLYVNSVPKTLTEFGTFKIRSKSSDWDDENPTELTIRFDNNVVVLKARKEDNVLLARFNLKQYERMLAAKSIQFDAGALRFVINERDIEGMRDFASKMPDGATEEGGYVVKHAPDVAPTNLPDASPVDDKSVVGKAIAIVRENRKTELRSIVKRIDSAKAGLKQAMIAAEPDLIAKRTTEVEQLQLELKKQLESPLATRSIVVNNTAEGQVGLLTNVSLRVIQILNRSKGEALVGTVAGARPAVLKVVGADLTNMVDDAKFHSSQTFVVAGTYAYETVAGGSKSIFELHAIAPDSIFSEEDRKPFLVAADPENKVNLTEAEATQAKTARETRVAVQREKMAAAKAEADTKESEAKVRRSKSFLESGKIFLKKDNYSAARKQLEKAVAEAPNSESGKEAAKLIDTLPAF